MQDRVIKLNLHILIVTRHIYFKFQANTFYSVIYIQFMLQFKNIFKVNFFTFKWTLALSQQKGNMSSKKIFQLV